MGRLQSSVFNFESTVNSKYLCLCMACLFVCFKRRLGMVHFYILALRIWQPCKDEGIFPLRTAAQTACSSLHVHCAQEGHFRIALPGWSKSRFCTGLHWRCALWCGQAGASPAAALPAVTGTANRQHGAHLSHVVHVPVSTFLFTTVSLEAAATGVCDSWIIC